MDNTKRFLKPVEGALVRDPATKEILAEQGTTKPWTGPRGRYWRRRVRDKSVIIVDQTSKVETQRNRSKEGSK